MTMRKNRTRAVRLAAAVAASAVVAGLATAHPDDPKVRDRLPKYAGPGYQASIDGPVGNAPVGFPSDGILLRSWLTLDDLSSGADNANDCWGYVSGSGREYAIIGLSNGTAFVEVTDPDAPSFIQHMSGPNSLWRDVKVFGTYAYSVTEGSGAGIQVFNLASIDAGTVTLANTINAGGATSTHNVAIDETSGFLYRCGGGEGAGGLRIYSLANPATPALVGSWQTRYVHDLQVVTYDSGPWAGRQIAFCCSGFNGGYVETGLDVLDVTDKSNIIDLGRLVYPNGAYSHQVWISEDRQYAYLNDELDEDGSIATRTHVVDISDLAAPIYKGYFDNGLPAIGHNLYVLGDRIFEANYRSGLRVFDASDPISPVEIASFDTWPGDDAASFNGMWSTYPYLPSGNVICSDIEKGLFVLTVAEPQLAIVWPTGVPELIDPDGDTIQVRLEELEPGGLVPGTGMLHWGAGEGTISTPLVPVGGDLYEATIDATACGDEISFYVTAQAASGIMVASPASAPSETYRATSATAIVTISSNDMETTAGYQVTNDPSLTDGAWSRGVPAGAGDRGDPIVDGDGSGACWLTDNVAGNSDVDGGPTLLTTPNVDLSAIADPYVSYARWFTNDDADGDRFEFAISNNGGGSWVTVESVGAFGGWRTHSFRVADHVAPTATVRFRISASDNPNDSVTEAGFDALRIYELECGSAAVAGDVDGDGDVDFNDLVSLLAAWGPCPKGACPADFDDDGQVAFSDLLALLANWTG